MFATLAQAAPLAGFAGLMIVFWIVALIASIFWIWMLIDALTSPMPTNEKILWVLVVLFLHLLGAIIYYIVKRPRTHHPHAA
jgi:hypothetical protein